MKAGLITDTYLDAQHVEKHKKSYVDFGIRFLKDDENSYNLLYCVISALTFVNRLFFILLLFDLIKKSTELMNVYRTFINKPSN